MGNAAVLVGCYCISFGESSAILFQDFFPKVTVELVPIQLSYSNIRPFGEALGKGTIRSPGADIRDGGTARDQIPVRQKPEWIPVVAFMAGIDGSEIFLDEA